MMPDDFRHVMAVRIWREAWANGWYWVAWAAVAEDARNKSLMMRIRGGLGL